MKDEILLRTDFETKRPMLKALGEWVKENICNAISEQKGSHVVDKFLQIPPSIRVKNIDSFIEKALIRKADKYNDPLNEITDQVGVRFVVLLLDDVNFIGNIIKDMVKCSYEKCRDFEQEKLADPDHFAYQSDHYVIKTKEKFNFNGVTIDIGVPCEIQIRTILQHAYAEMAHVSDYKPHFLLPENEQKYIKRLLAKGSALIEITDDAFKDIQTMLTQYYDNIDKLLNDSAKIYKSITGEDAVVNTQLSKRIVNAYLDLLQKDTANSDKLNDWVSKNYFLGEMLKKKRNESVFYKDSIVVLLGWLVSNNRIAVPKRWPEDINYLEDFYNAIGISTAGLF
jgi:ppGpp synthetase/RelA/SpoT-type nucleotidyltranferase